MLLITFSIMKVCCSIVCIVYINLVIITIISLVTDGTSCPDGALKFIGAALSRFLGPAFRDEMPRD